jgi:hypothetical protein
MMRTSDIGFTKEGTVIKFRCHSCRQKIAVNIEGAGARIHCPSCATGLTVPAETAPEFALAVPLVPAPRMELLPPTRPATENHPPWWPHMARWLSERLTQTLFSQRRQLLDAQALTTARVEELQQRLKAARENLQRREAGYRARITELERELAIARRENNHLQSRLAASCGAELLLSQ